MFGNPVSNNKGWNTKKAKSCSTRVYSSDTRRGKILVAEP
jgi:hypothetical protein